MGEPRLPRDLTPEELAAIDPWQGAMSGYQQQLAAPFQPPEPVAGQLDLSQSLYTYDPAVQQAQIAQTQAAPPPMVPGQVDLSQSVMDIQPPQPRQRYQSVPLVRPQEPAQETAGAPVPRQAGAPGGGLGGVVRRQQREAGALAGEYQSEADRYRREAERAVEQRAYAYEQAARDMEAQESEAEVTRMMRDQEIADELEKRAKVEEQVARRRDKARQQMEADAAEVNALQAPRDRRSDATVAMGAIAVALSGIGDAMMVLAGGRSDFSGRALDIINQAVERDLNEQREANQLVKDRAAGSEERFGRVDQEALTEEQRTAIRTAAIRDRYAARLDEIAEQQRGTNAAMVATDAGFALRQQAAQQREQVADELAREQYHRADQLELMRAKLAGAGGMTTEKKLKLEEQALKNEKLRQELASGPERKLNEAEGKILRAAQGAAGSRQNIERGLRTGMPWFGTRGVSEVLVPDRFATNEAAAFDADLDQIADVVLRDKSGAVISDPEVERELRDARSGNDARAMRAVKRLLERYDARARSVGLDPMTGQPAGRQQPPAQTADPRVRNVR
jgi:hypothetical protein